jgi:hypothetical protein
MKHNKLDTSLGDSPELVKTVEPTDEELMIEIRTGRGGMRRAEVFKRYGEIRNHIHDDLKAGQAGLVACNSETGSATHKASDRHGSQFNKFGEPQHIRGDTDFAVTTTSDCLRKLRRKPAPR